MKKKEPNFKWWQRLIFKYFGVRRVDILKLALARLKYNNKNGGTYYLCPILYDIMEEVGLVDRVKGLLVNRRPMGFYVHDFIPKFKNPYGFNFWNNPWWAPGRYEERKEFLQELIKEYKNDKKRFQINIYNHG